MRRNSVCALLVLPALVSAAAACSSGGNTPPAPGATSTAPSGTGVVRGAAPATTAASSRASLRSAAPRQIEGDVLVTAADPPVAVVLWRPQQGEPRDRLTLFSAEGDDPAGALRRTDFISTQPAGAEPRTVAVTLPEMGDADLAANRELVRRFYSDVIDNGRVESVETYVAPDYVQHNPAVPQGIEGVRQLARLLSANPSGGKNRTEVAVVADGDVVALVSRLATAGGSGGQLVDVFRVVDGKVAEHWDFTPAPTN